MSMAFKPMAVVTVADATDPNTTAPAADRIFDVGRRTESEELADGVGFFLDFTAGAGPTADVEVWILDRNSEKWALVTSFAALAEFVYKAVRTIRSAEVFIRYTAIAGAPTNVRARVASI